MLHEEHEGREAHKGLSVEVETLARTVVDSGIKVHRALGPGLLESVYERCLAHELKLRGVPTTRQLGLPITYEGLKLDAGYRLDMVVADAIIVEVKAVEVMTRLHEAQILTYLKLTGCRLGLLMNFNVPLLKDGIRRLVR